MQVLFQGNYQYCFKFILLLKNIFFKINTLETFIVFYPLPGTGWI